MKIKFKAKIPMFVRLEKSVTKKIFLTLSDDSRRCDQEFFNKKIYNHYYEILPPSLNMVIRKLKNKLDKQKIYYTESFVDGFLIIESIVE